MCYFEKKYSLRIYAKNNFSEEDQGVYSYFTINVFFGKFHDLNIKPNKNYEVDLPINYLLSAKINNEY